MNSVTSILDFTVRQVVGFFVSPILVHGLGNHVYGLWQILNQLSGYAGVTDIRVSQVLKWSIAKDRAVTSEKGLREQVGAAFIISLIILPVLLLLGSAIAWYAPLIANTTEEYYFIVRVTCLILVLNIIAKKILDLLESVLRGMNLGFKNMGVRSVLIILGGVSKAGVIYFDYGMIGLAVVVVAISLLTAAAIYIIIKKNIPWFGVSRPSRKRVSAFGRLSGWYMGYALTFMLLMASEKIILGYFAGPELVTQYAFTLFAIMAMQGLTFNINKGVIPGFGKLFGTGEFAKFRKARRIMALNASVCVAALGGTSILLNGSFVGLWVGSERFAGSFENLLLVIIAAQVVFFQLDSSIIDVTLDLKQKVLYTLISGCSTIIIGAVLIPLYGISGLCIAMLTGRMVVSIGYPIIVARKTKSTFENNNPVYSLIRPIVMIGFVFFTAYYLSLFTLVTNWVQLVILAAVSGLIFGIFFLFAGLRKEDRSDLYEVFRGISLKKE